MSTAPSRAELAMSEERGATQSCFVRRAEMAGVGVDNGAHVQVKVDLRYWAHIPSKLRGARSVCHVVWDFLVLSELADQVSRSKSSITWEWLKSKARTLLSL